MLRHSVVGTDWLRLPVSEVVRGITNGTVVTGGHSAEVGVIVHAFELVGFAFINLQSRLLRTRMTFNGQCMNTNERCTFPWVADMNPTKRLAT